MKITYRYVGITISASRPKGGSWISPNPGMMVWRVPSGRSYTTTPTEYPV
jgi:hypothetical protein